MVIAKDEKGTLHIAIGPEELAENLPARVAEALLKDCCFAVDERADYVNEIFLKGREWHDQRNLHRAIQLPERRQRAD